MKLIKKKKQLSCERYYREREKKRGTEREGGRQKERKRERERNYGKSVSNTSYHLFIILGFSLVFISHSCNMSTKASIRFST